MRLRTVSAQTPGWTRRRRGRGFVYLDAAGGPLAAADVERIRALVIPPAWTDVWICPDEKGHLQAVGTDDAGRRQYLYHPEWRRKRDLVKHERAVAMAAKLPAVRRRILRTIPASIPDQEAVLDLAVRLIDLGCFRIGSDEYTETNGSFGLSTLELRHVSRDKERFVFDYVGKSGVQQQVIVDDPAVVASLRLLSRRRDKALKLLAVRVGRRWTALTAADVNAHVSELFGMEVTSKDFRTWHATVAAALALSEVERASSRTGRAKQIRMAVQEAADLLGNTPTVAKSSYIDPRILDLFESGTTIGDALKRLPKDPAKRRDRIDRVVQQLLS